MNCWNLFEISNLDLAGRKPSFLNKPAWASLAFRTVLNRENRILYNKSNSGCFRLNTRKMFFCNERLLFVNETMYSEETENCLYSYLLENKGELVSGKKTRELRCVISGTHQQGPHILEPGEDQNHVFQKHVVVTFSAIVCLSLCPRSVFKGEIISVCVT